MLKLVPDSNKAPLAEFLNTLPSPLTVVLVNLGPSIARLRRFLEILSWKTSWEDSCLALALWWAGCLLSGLTLRYLLPLLIIAVSFLLRWTSSNDVLPVTASEDSLHQTITDLTTIYSLLPRVTFATTSIPIFPVKRTLRILGIIYIPYLFISYFIRLRILIAVGGTILLTWRARWASLIRGAFWRSAYFRWITYYAWALISGTPLPARTSSIQTSGLSSGPISTNSSRPTNTIRFLFAVYENQRWWMGLDWTAALLPSERPSWCTSAQQPVSPPVAFNLPTSTTVYLPDPVRKGARVRRTARWTWEEPEWRVVVRKEGSGVTRVERPLPSLVEEGASASAGRILKAAGRMRQASLGGEGSSPERQKEGGDSDGKAADKKDDASDEEPYTDADGWVYGDNKWEGGSARGGIGKYTRYRRWTRVAVLTETVEAVENGEVGIQRDELPNEIIVQGSENNPANAAQVIPLATQGHIAIEDDGSRLRRRLKAAVTAASQH
ncbi:hypothetical protein PHLCEN_2v11972 [Hermanssonia centrifuga]|uniref:TECPR1-like DysF domain-containing protein n=1 Tax=Hermanssonia centrifuga TaxID=98765 RepID=A0A2R6NIK7_9APHY|nr:hypothetical protein PHLCEN_2v11972 [Hermanssonia centrifuga]